jgi:hypothetical protein
MAVISDLSWRRASEGISYDPQFEEVEDQIGNAIFPPMLLYPSRSTPKEFFIVLAHQL